MSESFINEDSCSPFALDPAITSFKVSPPEETYTRSRKFSFDSNPNILRSPSKVFPYTNEKSLLYSPVLPHINEKFSLIYNKNGRVGIYTREVSLVISVCIR